jgi:hypothetical protein
MGLKEMRFDQQVEALKTALRSGRNSFASYLALFALRHHLATKHAPDYSVRPVLRWYLGQLAKEYIGKYYNEASRGLEGFAEIGLLETSEGQNAQRKEYRLEDALYPALLAVLEGIFGKEYIANAIARAKFYRNPGTAKAKPYEKGISEVIE